MVFAQYEKKNYISVSIDLKVLILKKLFNFLIEFLHAKTNEIFQNSKKKNKNGLIVMDIKIDKKCRKRGG